MSRTYRFIILLHLFSSPVSAYETFVEALYWRATENIDWVAVNDMHLPDQNISYRTIHFHHEPNFRIGFGSQAPCYTAFYYTRFYSHGEDAVYSNAISGFLSDRIINFPDGYVYQAGQIDQYVNYNIFDADLGRSFILAEKLTLTPIFGLRGGWINQKYQTHFQGPVSAIESVKNNFVGAGPKAEIHSEFDLYCNAHYQFNWFANFSISYLWGHWNIKDVYIDSTPATVHLIVPSRNLGALTTQTIIGLGFCYRDLSLKLGYEIMDWYDQCQFFDNGTGAHSNDLILQGFTLKMTYLLI